ncbi:hypothetical protein [Streptomyces coffeae]|uniref:Uncharacterized protein n=1 Tax=Streptomyces coffeae TaxID=621382 RepID=A0ABS1NAA8_9ACTN|nr:hypothetical protein [Streptomyces coffeae]MBL1096894.1 hypothetical protein [Streptomyces coffeae]
MAPPMPERDKQKHKKDPARRRRNRLFLLAVLLGIPFAIPILLESTRGFFTASKEGNAVALLIAWIEMFASVISLLVVITLRDVRILYGQIWQWLTSRAKVAVYSTLVGTFVVAAVIVLIASHNMALAGLVIIMASGVRIALGRSLFSYWPEPIAQLRLHVASEVFFHCLALWGLTAGLLMEVAAVKGLETAPRLTLTASLSLAFVVAANKATARTRKLCTALETQISDVIRAFGALHNGAENGNKTELAEKVLERVDGLDRALRTQLNTGYKFAGKTVLPDSTRAQLINRLNDAAQDSSADAHTWVTSRTELLKIQEMCRRWTDVMA